MSWCMGLKSTAVKKENGDRYEISHGCEGVNSINRESAIVLIQNKTIPTRGEKRDMTNQLKIQLPQVIKTDEASASTSTSRQATKK
ncbi:hypothetical protein Bca4012_076860 [Brassica carinata]|uniref:Uncharacterized protein n=2 Tax=Brassica TaxID=3705 RepID=A0A8S9N8A1_BRACR|nr:hypothetical protein F2Q69_00053927 [Brassica cretica]KAG2265797.1 hypothetical protein Bca52824_072876 [Brassica carinata]